MLHTKNATRPTKTGSGIFLPIDEFHEHLNKHNTITSSLPRRLRRKVRCKIPFLDCFLTYQNNTQQTTVYRNPTHTDRLLDHMSYNPTSHNILYKPWREEHKIIVCNSHDSLTNETKPLNTVFIKNNYSTDFHQTTNKALSARMPEF